MTLTQSRAMTVIMPARNAQHTIAQAADSILRQLKSNDRLIICDDSSLDRTRLLLKHKYGANAKVTLMHNDRQLGVSLTLNKILDEVSTDYIVRMDADDISLPGRLAIQRQALEQTHFSFVGGLIKKNIFLIPTLLPTSPFSLPKEAAKLALVVSNPFFHPGAAFHLSAIKDLGGYKQVQAQDYDLWLRAAISGYELQREPGWGLIYRTHKQQVSKKYGQSLSDLNSTDANLVKLRLALANSLGLPSVQLARAVEEARINLRREDSLMRLKRWA